MTIAIEKEDDGRYLAIADDAPGMMMAYGATEAEARDKLLAYVAELKSLEGSNGKE